jgi:hypothetical protein
MCIAREWDGTDGCPKMAEIDQHFLRCLACINVVLPKLRDKCAHACAAVLIRHGTSVPIVHQTVPSHFQSYQDLHIEITIFNNCNNKAPMQKFSVLNFAGMEVTPKDTNVTWYLPSLPNSSPHRVFGNPYASPVPG